MAIQTDSTTELLTLPAVVAANARRIPDGEAIVDGDERITFGELHARATRITRGLIAYGVEPGDRVAIWAPNSARWLEVLAGATGAGATVVPISTRFKGREAAHVLRKSGAKVLLTVRGFLGTDYVGMLREADADLADIATVLITDTGETDGVTAWEAFLADGEAVPESDALARAAAVRPEDLVHIIFTSGTTGQPKGAMVTHGRFMRTAQQINERFDLGGDDRTFIILPFFHVFGLTMSNCAALAGGVSVIASVFEPDATVELLDQERITFVPGPPPIFQAIMAAPSRAGCDLSMLRLAFVTSTGVPGALLRQLVGEGLFRSVAVGYGLTEGIIVSLSRLDDDIDRTAEWSGQLMPGVEVDVVATDGSPAAPGAPGELVVKTETLMKGYFEDPAATAAAFDERGWLRTGDIGIVENGFVRITDRAKDMYIVGGFNAYPAEIENILTEHPAIQQAAVVGMPDERLGEVGAAFVILADGASATAEEVIGWARENMANYKVPRLVEFVSEFPLTPSMKVAKFQLRDRLAQRATAS